MKGEVQVASSATAVERNQHSQPKTESKQDPESRLSSTELDRGNDSGVDLQVRAQKHT